MKKQQKYLAKNIGNGKPPGMKITLFLVLVLLPMNFAFASITGDGGGINGPSTRGEAIPIAMDGVVELEELIEANSICYQTGDRSRGVESFAQKLAFLIFGPNDFFFEKINLPEELGKEIRYDDQFGFSLRAIGGMDPRNFLNEDNLNLFSFDAYLQTYGKSWDEGDFAINPFPTAGSLSIRKTTIVDDQTKVLKTGLSLNNILPFFRWDSVQTLCDSYDDFGSCINPRRAIVGLKIQTSINHGTAVRLINFETNQPSAIVINTEELAQCMANEVRRVAE